MKQIVLWTALLLMAFGVIEGGAFCGLFYLERFKNIAYQPHPLSLNEEHKEILKKALRHQSEYITYSSTLGWTIRPNGSDGIAHSNSQGVRARRDYPALPNSQVIRISVFGDSFTHCNDVRDEDTWAAKLEQMDPGIEVLNFGVGAYGLDQAFLRYKHDGVRFNSHILLIGFMSENIVRGVNVFRLFLYL